MTPVHGSPIPQGQVDGGGSAGRGDAIVRIQREISRDVIVAIESNLFELYLCFGRMPDAQVDSRPDMLRVKTGLPHELLNGVFRARIPEDHPDVAIRQALEDFLSEQVPFLWWVGPATEPPHLGKYLENCGLVLVGDLSGMAMDLDALKVPPARPRELSIEPVRDEADLEAWMVPLALGYEMPEAAAQGLFDFLRSVGFGPSVPLRHYLGRWLGHPVATSTLFFGAGVAGVYVTVVPKYRRQGIGSAMTLVPLRAARASGYRVGITHVPEFRLGFHRKLGFKPYCNLSTYIPRALVRGGPAAGPR